MTLIQILQKIFHKKKKKSTEKPVVVVVKPNVNGTVEDEYKPKIDPKTGEVIKDYILEQAVGENTQGDKPKYDFDVQFKLLSDQKDAYFGLSIGQIPISKKDQIIYDTKVIAKNILDAYKVLINEQGTSRTYAEKLDIKTKYDQLRKWFSNSNLYLRIGGNQIYSPVQNYDTLGNIAYDMPLPINQTVVINTGGNVNTNKTPSEADLNTRPNQIGTVYPQWTNKSYLTSEYVIYNGLTYKNAAQIVGNNNNTPDKDSRWVRV